MTLEYGPHGRGITRCDKRGDGETGRRRGCKKKVIGSKHANEGGVVGRGGRTGSVFRASGAQCTVVDSREVQTKQTPKKTKKVFFREGPPKKQQGSWLDLPSESWNIWNFFLLGEGGGKRKQRNSEETPPPSTMVISGKPWALSPTGAGKAPVNRPQMTRRRLLATLPKMMLVIRRMVGTDFLWNSAKPEAVKSDCFCTKQCKCTTYSFTDHRSASTFLFHSNNQPHWQFSCTYFG